MWVNLCNIDGYVVSEFGDVRGIDRVIMRSNGRPLTVKGQIMLQRVNKWGYHQVQLQVNGKKTLKFVHVLVWEAFNGEKPKLNEKGEKLEIGHRDGNTHNNSLSNLYLCTHKDNCNHPLTRKRQSERMMNNQISKGLISPNRTAVVRLDLNGKFEKEYEYIGLVTQDGFSVGNVCTCCKGKYGKRGNVTKNKVFIYKEDYEKMLGEQPLFS